jgi:hypothetical protein
MGAFHARVCVVPFALPHILRFVTPDERGHHTHDTNKKSQVRFLHLGHLGGAVTGGAYPVGVFPTGCPLLERGTERRAFFARLEVGGKLSPSINHFSFFSNLISIWCCQPRIIGEKFF